MQTSKNPWQHSQRSEDRWNKGYVAVYRDHGIRVTDPKIFRRRSDAEEYGMVLQAKADAILREEGARIKAELIAAETPLKGEVVS